MGASPFRAVNPDNPNDPEIKPKQTPLEQLRPNILFDDAGFEPHRKKIYSDPLDADTLELFASRPGQNARRRKMGRGGSSGTGRSSFERLRRNKARARVFNKADEFKRGSRDGSQSPEPRGRRSRKSFDDRSPVRESRGYYEDPRSREKYTGTRKERRRDETFRAGEEYKRTLKKEQNEMDHRKRGDHKKKFWRETPQKKVRQDKRYEDVVDSDEMLDDFESKTHEEEPIKSKYKANIGGSKTFKDGNQRGPSAKPQKKGRKEEDGTASGASEESFKERGHREPHKKTQKRSQKVEYDSDSDTSANSLKDSTESDKSIESYRQRLNQKNKKASYGLDTEDENTTPTPDTSELEHAYDSLDEDELWRQTEKKSMDPKDDDEMMEAIYERDKKRWEERMSNKYNNNAFVKSVKKVNREKKLLDNKKDEYVKDVLKKDDKSQEIQRPDTVTDLEWEEFLKKHVHSEKNVEGEDSTLNIQQPRTDDLNIGNDLRKTNLLKDSKESKAEEEEKNLLDEWKKIKALHKSQTGKSVNYDIVDTDDNLVDDEEEQVDDLDYNEQPSMELKSNKNDDLNLDSLNDKPDANTPEKLEVQWNRFLNEYEKETGERPNLPKSMFENISSENEDVGKSEVGSNTQNITNNKTQELKKKWNKFLSERNNRDDTKATQPNNLHEVDDNHSKRDGENKSESTLSFEPKVLKPEIDKINENNNGPSTNESLGLKWKKLLSDCENVTGSKVNLPEELHSEKDESEEGDNKLEGLRNTAENVSNSWKRFVSDGEKVTGTKTDLPDVLPPEEDEAGDDKIEQNLTKNNQNASESLSMSWKRFLSDCENISGTKTDFPQELPPEEVEADNEDGIKKSLTEKNQNISESLSVSWQRFLADSEKVSGIKPDLPMELPPEVEDEEADRVKISSTKIPQNTPEGLSDNWKQFISEELVPEDVETQETNLVQAEGLNNTLENTSENLSLNWKRFLSKYENIVGVNSGLPEELPAEEEDTDDYISNSALMKSGSSGSGTTQIDVNLNSRPIVEPSVSSTLEEKKEDDDDDDYDDGVTGNQQSVHSKSPPIIPPKELDLFNLVSDDTPQDRLAKKYEAHATLVKSVSREERIRRWDEKLQKLGIRWADFKYIWDRLIALAGNEEEEAYDKANYILENTRTGKGNDEDFFREELGIPKPPDKTKMNEYDRTKQELKEEWTRFLLYGTKNPTEDFDYSMEQRGEVDYDPKDKNYELNPDMVHTYKTLLDMIYNCQSYDAEKYQASLTQEEKDEIEGKSEEKPTPDVTSEQNESSDPAVSLNESKNHQAGDSLNGSKDHLAGDLSNDSNDHLAGYSLNGSNDHLAGDSLNSSTDHLAGDLLNGSKGNQAGDSLNEEMESHTEQKSAADKIKASNDTAISLNGAKDQTTDPLNGETKSQTGQESVTADIAEDNAANIPSPKNLEKNENIKPMWQYFVNLMKQRHQKKVETFLAEHPPGKNTEAKAIWQNYTQYANEQAHNQIKNNKMTSEDSNGPKGLDQLTQNNNTDKNAERPRSNGGPNTSSNKNTNDVSKGWSKLTTLLDKLTKSPIKGQPLKHQRISLIDTFKGAPRANASSGKQFYQRKGAEFNSYHQRPQDSAEPKEMPQQYIQGFKDNPRTPYDSYGRTPTGDNYTRSENIHPWAGYEQSHLNSQMKGGPQQADLVAAQHSPYRTPNYSNGSNSVTAHNSPYRALNYSNGPHSVAAHNSPYRVPNYSNASHSVAAHNSPYRAPNYSNGPHSVAAHNSPYRSPNYPKGSNSQDLSYRVPSSPDMSYPSAAHDIPYSVASPPDGTYSVYGQQRPYEVTRFDNRSDLDTPRHRPYYANQPTEPYYTQMDRMNQPMSPPNPFDNTRGQSFGQYSNPYSGLPKPMGYYQQQGTPYNFPSNVNYDTADQYYREKPLGPTLNMGSIGEAPKYPSEHYGPQQYGGQINGQNSSPYPKNNYDEIPQYGFDQSSYTTSNKAFSNTRLPKNENYTNSLWESNQTITPTREERRGQPSSTGPLTQRNPLASEEVRQLPLGRIDPFNKNPDTTRSIKMWQSGTRPLVSQQDNPAWPKSRPIDRQYPQSNQKNYENSTEENCIHLTAPRDWQPPSHAPTNGRIPAGSDGRHLQNPLK